MAKLHPSNITAEFMARHIDKLPGVQRRRWRRRQGGLSRSVLLGRYRGVFDEPRAVAALAGEVIDPPRSRERSFCCGAGGGLAVSGRGEGRSRQPQSRERISRDRREHRRGRLPVLQYDVSRRPRGRIGCAAEAARHRADRRGGAASESLAGPFGNSRRFTLINGHFQFPAGRRSKFGARQTESSWPVFYPMSMRFPRGLILFVIAITAFAAKPATKTTKAKKSALTPEQRVAQSILKSMSLP